MPITKTIRWNIILVVIIGLYGIVTNEPYWRDNGHDPWLFDYFFWFTLGINGPSGFLADYLSWLTGTHSELRFGIQYFLWCVLLWPQWRVYDWFVRWRFESSRKQIVFYAVVLSLVVGGGVAAHAAWKFGHRPSEFFVDQYFWFVRIAGIACSGLVLFGYAYLVKRLRSNPTLQGTRQTTARP